MDPTTAVKIIDALRQAERPLIIAGKGVLTTEAKGELAQMAELLAAPVVFPGDAYGAMSYSSQWCVGMIGPGINANPLVNKLFREADLLLGIGLRPNSANTDTFLRESKGKLVFVGFDDEPVAHQGASLSCVAETKPALQELVRLFEPYRRKPNQERLAEIEANKQFMIELFQKGMQPYREDGPLHFGLVLEELTRHLPAGAILVGDIGNHNSWSTALLPRWGIDNLVQVGPWAAMGFGLPGAIGAKVACPERTVVGITGDGAFLMNCADFPTAVQQGLDIVYLVLNDGRHGMVEMLQRRGYGRTYATEIPPSDLVKFAESFGATGIRISHPSEIREGLQRAFKTKGTVVVDVISDSSIPYVSIPS
jgi:acetolactate synthase-1/2/3 large subunit